MKRDVTDRRDDFEVLGTRLPDRASPLGRLLHQGRAVGVLLYQTERWWPKDSPHAVKLTHMTLSHRRNLKRWLETHADGLHEAYVWWTAYATPEAVFGEWEMPDFDEWSQQDPVEWVRATPLYMKLAEMTPDPVMMEP